MSRSYNKHSCVKDSTPSKKCKQEANQIVRSKINMSTRKIYREEPVEESDYDDYDIDSAEYEHRGYKRSYEQWNIHDYKWTLDKDDPLYDKYRRK